MLADSPDAQGVPPTLRPLISARLDTLLAEERLVIQRPSSARACGNRG